jgi:hypothetical protein
MDFSDRDPFVELLLLKERGEERSYFGRRDRELIERLRARRRRAEEMAARRSAHMRCPQCGVRLTTVVRRGVETQQCPEGHGMWVPPGGLDEIREREHDAWFDRYVHMRW